MKYHIVIPALLAVILSACGGSSSVSGGVVTSIPAGFAKQVNVFGVRILATANVPDKKIMHAARVMAEYLDNNEDGIADNLKVVAELAKRKATLVMPASRAESGKLTMPIDTKATQILRGDKTIPGGASQGKFDATFEEVLHLISHEGFAYAYPTVFGEGEKANSLLTQAMDAARGGHHVTVPNPYPVGAWFIYGNNTCTYECMAKEYFYWALTTVLGFQNNYSSRCTDISNKWKLCTRAQLQTKDTAAYALFTGSSAATYMLPTKLPDGVYTPGGLVITTNTPAPTTGNVSLENYLKQNFSYVHNINGFYIVASNQVPNAGVTTPGTTGKDIFEHSVRLFSNFLDQNEDGIIDPDKATLSAALASKMLFISAHLTLVDKVSFSPQVEGKGLYAMSMQTDSWDYVKSYTGQGWPFTSLTSSTWRPNGFNALWEETFHTVTEAYSRTDPDFKFTPGAKLRKYMDDDIAAGTYDISVQNTEENGQYDRVTAVNEYIHQIWATQLAGHELKLNSHQKKALAHMKAKGVPMKINPLYNFVLGTRIK